MENEDPFSSFTIHPHPDPAIEVENLDNNYYHQIENASTVKDSFTREKLKTRRKEKSPAGNNFNKDTSRYKLIVKYGGYFKPVNKGVKEKYHAGKQKTIYADEITYSFEELLEEVSKLYPEDDTCKLSLLFMDKRTSSQSFIRIEDENDYRLMLSLYKEEKKVACFVTEEKNTDLEDGVRINETTVANMSVERAESCLGDIDAENLMAIDYEDDSDYCHSEESYHSLDSDAEDDIDLEYEGKFYSYDKDDPNMYVGAQFPHVIAFRRALSHYAVTNDFEYNFSKSEPSRVTAICASRECKWRIHAAVDEDDIQLPYNRVWKAKQQAVEEIYGKWANSLFQIGALREEILRRNPGSVVELKTEPEVGNERHFQRFFVALGACTSGFLTGCRPYIGIDACHLEGKWPGVIASAIAIDGNNWMFLVAFAVMEIENEESWEWFLIALHKAIGMPHGLVISSDMQKGLTNAIEKVYPLAEHRECMRHLFSNFKKQFHGDIFKFGLWGAARTYSPTRFDAFINEIEAECPTAIQYLNKEHNKLWSRSKFGTIAKCDHLTNNIAETFNNWISKERDKPIVELIDSIMQKLMIRLDQKRKNARSLKGPLVPKVADRIQSISRNLAGFEVRRSSDLCAEISKSGLRWEVNLQEQNCSCRAWQVKGTPCTHAAVFIASFRNPNWESYVHPYFMVSQLRAAYANRIATMPSKDDWLNLDLGYKMLPPKLKRLPGRPRKTRIRPADEPKKRSHKCSRCGLYGHHGKKCKNEVPAQNSEGSTSFQGTRAKRTKRGSSKGAARSSKRACPSNIFKLLQEENI